MKRPLIFIATYNEIDNIGQLIQDINKMISDQDLLIIDDASPDGTGILLDSLAKDKEHLHIIHRPRKLGLGTAHKFAMKYAIHYEFDILITMDADYSHHPKYLPILIKALERVDFIIGSRYIEGGGLDYGLVRTTLSRTANILSRYLLAIPLKECTTSYRGIRVSVLKRLNLDAIQSEGYSFFIECLFYITRLTKSVDEFPIFFEDRRAGTSKISKKEIFYGFLTLVRLARKRFFMPLLETKEQSVQMLPACSHCGCLFQSFLTHPSKPRIQNDRVEEDSSEALENTLYCLQCGVVHTNSVYQRTLE